MVYFRHAGLHGFGGVGHDHQASEAHHMVFQVPTTVSGVRLACSSYTVESAVFAGAAGGGGRGVISRGFSG